VNEPLPADGHNIEIELRFDVNPRGRKGDRQVVSTSIARELVAKGLARHTGGGKSSQFDWSEL
jgi:hypothetical protein